jgi:hypothetical protein
MKRFVLKRITTKDKEQLRTVRRAYRLLEDLPDSNVLLKNRFWAISEGTTNNEAATNDKVYEIRSYMDYCPAGTLMDILERYNHVKWDSNNLE